MISCTEFIPAYSELFTYLEDKYGRGEVDTFWEYLFAPTGEGIPLINFLEKEGLRGCFTYWSGTLNEEAADFTMYLNEKKGWFATQMHYCPSKGRLLELEKELGIKPYHDYCLHCDHYRESIEKAGFKYQYNFIGTDKASCSELAYDPKIFDGKVVIDEDTIIMDRRASQNEYFHPDFHSSMNMGIEYLGREYGIEAVREYLVMYTNDVYKKEIESIKKDGLSAIKAKIQDTYKKEKSEDALSFKLAEDKLCVHVKYCPAVKHLKKTGRKVSDWYRYTKEIVMQELARAGGLKYELEFYDEETGESKYCFIK